MSTWTADDLSRIGDATELQVSSLRPDGTLRPYVTIWGVRTGDAIYIRSAYGPDNGWFRRAKASGAGRIRAGDVERDVAFTTALPNAHTDIDAAYHIKYDRYGPAIVGTVVGSGTELTTLRVIPRAAAGEED